MSYELLVMSYELPSGWQLKTYNSKLITQNS